MKQAVAASKLAVLNSARCRVVIPRLRDVAHSTRRSLPDPTGFWLALAAVPAAVGGVCITIAVTEYHPPWTSAWFIAGAVACGLGCMSALLALVLYLAPKEPGDHQREVRTVRGFLGAPPKTPDLDRLIERSELYGAVVAA